MKNNESGRSMIEMLGVLAIIGVLSVGGIAGYAKAMSKYRTNKSIDQITQIVASTRNLFAGHRNYAALGTGENGAISAALIVKGHLVPDEMLKDKDDFTKTTIENPFAGSVVLSSGGKRSSDDGKAFVITYTDVPRDACIELATQDWGSGSSSGLVGICVNGNISAVMLGDSTTATANTSANTSTGSSTATTCSSQRSMSVLVASSACSSSETGLNTISWKFY